MYESGSVSSLASPSASELATATEQSLVESTTSFVVLESAPAYEQASVEASGLLSTRDVATAAESGVMSADSFADATETSFAYESSLVEATAFTDVLEVVSYSRETTSHIDPVTSFASSDRTSLELIDFDVTYDESTASWYTNWFQEDRILGDEDVLAVIGYVVDDAKDPAATVQVEYDATGDENVDARSTEVRVDGEERPKQIEGVPLDEDGYYRLVISEYSGYNSLTTLNTGFVH